MLNRIGARHHALKVKQFFRIEAVADRALVKASLNPIIESILANLECLTKIWVIVLPSINRANVNAEKIGKFKIGSSQRAQLFSLRRELRFVGCRSSSCGCVLSAHGTWQLWGKSRPAYAAKIRCCEFLATSTRTAA